MLVSQRIIWKDNTVLKDLSVDLNDLTAGTYTLPFVAAEDKLYIGSDLPFNHRYFYMGTTVNDVVSAASVEIWNGNSWDPAVDVIDQTSSASKSLKQSGILSWARDKSKTWAREETTENISDLSTLKIYDLFWVRISFSANFTAGTLIKYVGHKFANDSELGIVYPDLIKSDVYTAFASGKTDWIDQHIIAGEEIVRHLKKKQEIRSSNQILDWEQFNHAGIHKCAELLYGSFGSDYEENRKIAEARYAKAMNIGIIQVDRNGDGKLNLEERTHNIGMVRR